MTPPRLSAFDPGTHRFGFCHGDGTALPVAGAWRFPVFGDDLGAMLCFLDDRLAEHIDAFRPDAIAYEAPLLVIGAKYRDKRTGQLRTRTDNLAALRRTYSLGGHVEFVCRRRGIACSEVSLFAMKRELASFSHAGKADMVAAAEKLGVILPKTAADGREDAADAVAAWLLLLRSRSRDLSARFDTALWSSRGGLI